MYVYAILAFEWCFENHAKWFIDSLLFSVKLINIGTLDLEREKKASFIEMDPGIKVCII